MVGGNLAADVDTLPSLIHAGDEYRRTILHIVHAAAILPESYTECDG